MPQGTNVTFETRRITFVAGKGNDDETESEVFRNFSSGIKIRSAKVIPPDAGVLESPVLLVCNSSAYKEPIMPFTFESFKNNTISQNDMLMDAFLITNARNGPLAYNPSRITHDVREISTMFYGNCILIKKAFKVTNE